MKAYSRYYLSLKKSSKNKNKQKKIQINDESNHDNTSFQTQLNQKILQKPLSTPSKDTKFAQYVNSILGVNLSPSTKSKVMTAKQKFRDIKKCLSVRKLIMSLSVRQMEKFDIQNGQNIYENNEYKSKLNELRDSYNFLKVSDNLNIANLRFARTSKGDFKIKQKQIQASLKKNLNKREECISGWEHEEKSDFESLVVLDVDN